MSHEIVLDYARRVFERQRVPLPPFGFEVDWADQPSKHKLYLDTVKVPLPDPFTQVPRVDVGTATRNARQIATEEMPDLNLMASVLACYGIVDRRTEPNWNEDSARRLRAGGEVWARPTASGGGMYPAESYLIAGTDASVPTGVFHYDTAHHSLDRLSAADQRPIIAAATGVAAELYLVATLKFWKNAFKYNSFCYHVVLQDVGALLGSWRLVLAASGLAVEPILWFDEAPISAVLGIDGRTEAPFVVVPLGASSAASAVHPSVRPDPSGREAFRVWERSRRVRTFPMVEQVHAAALVGDRPRPEPERASAGTPGEVEGQMTNLPVPETRPGDQDLVNGMLRRRSSFGLLTGRPALDLSDLAWVLSAVDDAGHTGTDVAPAERTEPWIRSWVLANHVDGLESGIHAYRHGRLISRGPVDVGGLQRHYALTNYNLSEAAALVVVTVRLAPMIEAYGGRGYRMLGIEVGQAAQSLYLAATARNLGIGAVLGIDNLEVDALLGIDQTDERSMLFFLLGHRPRRTARYDHALLAVEERNGGRR